tara:strand:- start:15705 stop:15980 length:276 start_codon:yes stop_codon:yes gene_type:complete
MEERIEDEFIKDLLKSREKGESHANGFNVNHPKHYNQGIEMWDYAYSHDLDFFEGNIVKYVTRWKDKGGIEDLYKAKQYLDKLIEFKTQDA